MNAVYESEIEIVIHDVFDKPRGQMLESAAEFDQARQEYPDGTRERAILSRLFDLAWHGACSGKDGYLGSSTNCAFSVLYEVFGVDVIAFLFNQPWVPNTKINPFCAGQFLDRLLVLETAVGKLTEGDALPIFLPQTASYRWPCIVPVASTFLGGRHGLFLLHTFRELREFGELGVRMQRTECKLKVDINIFTSDDEYDYEILAFAAKPAKRERTELTDLIQ